MGRDCGKDRWNRRDIEVMWKSSEMEDKNENESRKNTGNIFKRQNTFRHLENLLNI